MVHLIGLAVSVLVSACGSGETSLRTMTPTNDERSKLRPVSPSSVEEQGGSLAPPVWKKVELNQRAASFLVEEGSDHTSVQESFWVGDGATTGMADYLFVVDDSVSMANIIESFSRGFERLSASDVFPVNARVAVMNMTPANPSNLRRRHPVVPSRAGVEQSPGFIHLIDADRIKAYNAFLADFGEDPLRYDGCGNWFGPKETNPQGVSCLLAHTQLGLHQSVAEAGLTAFGQLLERQRRRPLFREGAAVNVIMVSDTHDPGFAPATAEGRREVGFQELLAIQPTYAQLKAMVEEQQLVASFRVHAIAPRSDCSEPWIEDLDPAYFDVAEASGGVMADICDVDDYSEVIRSIVSPRRRNPNGRISVVGRTR